MQQLGYASFFAQGGDIGAGVSAWLGRLYPQAVRAIHLNYIPGSFRPGIGPDEAPVTTTEQAYLTQAAAWSAAEGHTLRCKAASRKLWHFRSWTPQ
jgi:pimeloyl-ACP methyl ester carboxylesterase